MTLFDFIISLDKTNPYNMSVLPTYLFANLQVSQRVSKCLAYVTWLIESVTCVWPRPFFLSRIHSLWTQKKTLIPYIYNVFIKDPFSNSPRKVINSNFSYVQTRLTLFDINHCACDLANWWTTLWLCSLGIESKIFARFNEGNIIPMLIYI